MSKNIPRAQSFFANIDRARHNLYQEKATTLHPMVAIPIYYRRMFKGDTFKFGIVESILRSQPTFAPLLSNWRLEFQWYFDSDANRYGWIDNNTRLTSQEVMNRKHHTMTPVYRQGEGQQYAINEAVQKHSLAEYSGIAVGSTWINNNDEPDDANDARFGYLRNIDFHLTYLNIIRNYHVNKQFPSIPYITSRPISAFSNYEFSTYSLNDMDKLFMFLRSCPNGINFEMREYEYTNISEICDAPEDLLNYYQESVQKFVDYLSVSENYFGGIFCTQFEPDLYQNLLANDQNLLRSVVTTQSINGETGITIEQFRLKNHLQGLYDKIFVSGGTDRDLSRTIWGIESNRDYDIPELLCVHSEIIGTNVVESNNSGNVQVRDEDVKSVPGGMSGNINTRRNGGRLQKFTARTSGSLMCLVTLTPLVSYSENIERHILENNFMDEFTPDMARKGFENIPLSDYTVLPRVSAQDSEILSSQRPLDQVVGKQVAWLREMTAVNRVHGEFTQTGEQRDWFLRRSFMRYDSTSDSTGPSISPYGNPLAFQYPFVTQTLQDPNFYLHVGVMCEATRPIPRRIMPNLGY